MIKVFDIERLQSNPVKGVKLIMLVTQNILF